MRTWGRPTNRDGSRGPWAVVSTADDGSNDLVFVTALCQALLLNLNESPFYADYGIPAHPSVVTQVVPDFYVVYMQKRFAPFFANLLISKQTTPDPSYNVSITTHQGVKLNASIPIPY